MSGKGSKPRPFSVDSETYTNNWNAIFNRESNIPGDAKAEDEAFEWLQKEKELREVVNISRPVQLNE